MENKQKHTADTFACSVGVHLARMFMTSKTLREPVNILIYACTELRSRFASEKAGREAIDLINEAKEIFIKLSDIAYRLDGGQSSFGVSPEDKNFSEQCAKAAEELINRLRLMTPTNH